MVSTHRPDERLLDTAYDLFCARGVRDVGVDELVGTAGVAKATLYRHFASKDELILAFLRMREERWTVGWLEAGLRERRGPPEERLLAVFDLFDEWLKDPEFAGCPFVKTLLEMGPAHPAGAASIEHLGTVRGLLTRLAADCGFGDPDEVAQSMQLLLYGSIIQTGAGNTAAAGRARQMAQTALEQFRQPATLS